MNQKNAFTLVELSIVLVIVGVLIGGILVGQSLIQSAKMSKTISYIAQFDSVALTYKAKYKYLPGDNPNDLPPDGMNEGTKGCFGDGTIDTGCFVWPKAGTHYLGGNRQFFKVVSSGKFHPDPTAYHDGTTSSKGPDFLSSGPFQTTYPAPIAKDGSDVGFWVSCTVNGYWNCAPGITENYYSIVQGYREPNAGNNFMVPKGYNNSVTGYVGNGGTVIPQNAAALDQKLDDGKPDSGFVMSGGNGPDFGAPSRLFTNANCATGSTYNVNDNTPQCMPIIRVAAQAGGL